MHLNSESERFKKIPEIVYSISFSTIIVDNVSGISEVFAEGKNLG